MSSPGGVGLRLDEAFADLLQDSHLRLVGRPLIPDGPKDAAFLYRTMAAPLLAHDTADDPRIVFANLAAQRCFDYTAAEFAELPSRLTAKPGDRAARQALLDDVLRKGFADGYAGTRVAKSGRRFRITATTVWNLVDRAGVRHGQAATFRIEESR